MKEQVKVREWKGWAVVDSYSYVLTNTIMLTRSGAIGEWDHCHPGASFEADKEKYGVRVERITISGRQ